MKQTQANASPATKSSKKVVTHRVSKTYQYGECADVSESMTDLMTMEALVPLRISTGFELAMMPQRDISTMPQSHEGKQMFKTSNSKDKSQSFTEQVRLSEHFNRFQLVEAGKARSRFLNRVCAAVPSSFPTSCALLVIGIG